MSDKFSPPTPEEESKFAPPTFEEMQQAAIRQTSAGLSPAELAEFGKPGIRSEVARTAFSQKTQDEFDRQQEAQDLEYAAANATMPAVQMAKARQLHIVKPHYDLDYIIKNLPTIEKEVQAEGVPWDLVAFQHPVLAKYLKDPETAAQTLQDTASLTGIHRAVGGNVSVLGDDGKPTTKYQLPAWLMQAKDSLVHNVNATFTGFGYALYNANEELNKGLRYIPGMSYIIDSPEVGEDRKNRWLEAWREEMNQSTHGKDYLGFMDWDKADLASKIGRVAEVGVGGITKNLDLLVGAALGGKIGAGGSVLANPAGYARGVMAFNTAYAAMDLAPKMQAETGSPLAGLALAAGGGPVLGKLMSWSPVGTAVGARLDSILENQVAKSVATAFGSKSYAQMLRVAVLKGGFDLAAGQVALGMQGAASAGMDQIALGIGGKSVDSDAIAKAFMGGISNPEMIGLSLIGTGRTIVAGFGRQYRAQHMASQLEQLRESIIDSKTAVEDKDLHEKQVHEIVNSPGNDSTFYFPIDKFNEVAEKGKMKARDIAAEIHGDNGAAYDKAVAEGASHLEIPIEKMKKVFEAKELGDAAMVDGTLDKEIMSKAESSKVSEEFQTSLDAALKVKPEELSPTDKGIYDALVAQAGVNEQAAKEMFAQTKALQAQHPELTLQQIHDATWGPGGLFGPPKVTSGIEKSWDGGEDQLVYSHSDAPLKLYVNSGEIEGKPSWIVDLFGFKPEIARSRGESALIKEYGGKGHATSIYLAALKDAQSAGRGFASDTIRTESTDRMYERLKRLGLPFERKEGRYYISSEALKSVDISKLSTKEVTSMLSPVDQAVSKGLKDSGMYGSEEWSKVTKDEIVKDELIQKENDVQEAARERLRIAIKAGVPHQISREREILESAATDEIKKDQGQRARHFFYDNELWDANDSSNALMMRDLETGKPLKLLKSEIEALGFRADDLGSRIVTEDPAKAMDVDMAASALGYSGTGATGTPARQMLAGLRDALPEKEWGRQWANAKLKSIYGRDLLDNPKALMNTVLDSVHNEKVVPLLISRLRSLVDQLDPIRKARAAMPQEVWSDFADKIMHTKGLKDIRPEAYARAAKAASDRASKSLSEGNINKAFDATEAQLLNHYLYRSARVLEGSLGSMYSKLVEKSNSISLRAQLGKADPAYRQLHDSILGAVGIGDQGSKVETALETFLTRVSENSQDQNLAADQVGGWDKDVVSRLLSGDKAWKELTPGEAEQVFNAVTNIQHIARVQNETMKAIRNGERDSLLASAQEHLSRGGIIPPKDIVQEKGQEGAKLSDRNLLTQAWKDAYNDAPRQILSYLGSDVKEKVDGGYLDSRYKAKDLLRNLYEPWKKTQEYWEKDPYFHKNLPGLADELRLKDANGNDLNGGLSKKYLVQLLKWMGSTSGREKVLKAFDTIPDHIFSLAGKYLTPTDLNAIQAEHKFFDEKLLPLKSEAWERRKGLPFKKVEPMGYSITFSNGETHDYDGGYYPIHWDGRPGVEKQARPVQMDEAGKIYPQVPDGSFKERTKFVGIPDLDWNNIPAHLLSDIHNLAFGDFVQDANRVLLDPRMTNIIRRYLGPDYAAWPRSWMERVAHDSSGSVSGHLSDLNDATRLSRSAFITGAIGLNLPIFAAHMPHVLAVATMRDGIAMAVTHAAPSVGRVLESASTGLITGTNPLHEEIMSKSKYLPLYLDDLRESMGRWFKGTYDSQTDGWVGKWDRAQDKTQMVGFWHLREMTKLACDMIWDAKYRYGMGKHGNEELAIKDADEQVRAAMPNYSVMDTPSILAEKHGSIASSMLIFHTFWAKYREMFDEQRRAMVDMPFKVALAGGPASGAQAAWGTAKFAGRTLAALTFGVVMGEFFKGQGKMDNEDWQTWLIRRELTAPFKMFPYASDLFEHGAEGLVTGKKIRDVAVDNPYFMPYVRGINAVTHATDPRRPVDEKVTDLATSLLMLAGVPAVAPMHAARYDYQAIAGDERPRGSLDVISGNIYPKKYGRSARYMETNPLIMLQDFAEKGK